jgi:hypothetical protein
VGGLTVDLSGNYRDDPWGWIRYGAGAWRWRVVSEEFAVYVVYAAVLTVALGPAYLLLMRAPLPSGAFGTALGLLRGRGWDPMNDQGVPLAGRLHLLLVAFAVTVFVTLVLIAEGAGLTGASWPEVYYGAGWICGLLLAGGTAYLSLRLSFANALIADQRMGVFQSYAASWRLTAGHVRALAAFYSILVLLFVAGLLGFGVGLFFTVPLIALAEASLYLHATGQVPRSSPRP